MYLSILVYSALQASLIPSSVLFTFTRTYLAILLFFVPQKDIKWYVFARTDLPIPF
jgi:hypothetical protein